MIDYNFCKFPDKFTHEYLIDINSDSYEGIDYDDELDVERDIERKYIDHFFQLNEWLKFSFRYYTKTKTISNIYIMTDEADNGWYEFYRFKILNDIIKEFNISENKFNWNFDFKKYSINYND